MTGDPAQQPAGPHLHRVDPDTADRRTPLKRVLVRVELALGLVEPLAGPQCHRLPRDHGAHLTHVQRTARSTRELQHRIRAGRRQVHTLLPPRYELVPLVVDLVPVHQLVVAPAHLNLVQTAPQVGGR